MKCNPHIFRAYDIRGLVDKDLTPEMARAIGKAFGTFIQRKKLGNTVAVGKDVRLSSEGLQQACIEGLLSTGCDVTDIGTVLTPMMYYALAELDYDAGINITGSHNPKDQNGFKLAVKPFTSVHGEDIQTLRTMIENNDFVQGEGSLQQEEVHEAYMKATAERIDPMLPQKVVIDCGSGTAGLFAPQFYRMLGCEVIELYCEVDGDFPHHLPDPQVEENVADLKQAVVEHNADLGLAFDGDGDRVGVVDKNGVLYPGDILMIPLAQAALELHPGANIIVDVKSTQILLDKITELGGKPILGRTGPPSHKENMKLHNAPLGGEISGHYFIADNHWGYDDAIFSGARILHAIAKTEQTVDQYFADLPTLASTPEIKIPCPDDKKFDVVEDVVEHYKKEYSCSTVDGVRVQFSDTSWGLIRASNTTPNLTVRFEAPTEKERDAIRNTTLDVLRDIFKQHSLELK